MDISNVKIYDLRESVIASGNPMRIAPVEYTDEEFEKGLARMKRLVHSSQESDAHCHDNALVGIRVSFDIVYPQYWSMEAQRYHFFDIVSSSSKMHRLVKMDMNSCFNDYIDEGVRRTLMDYIDIYNNEPCQENWQYVISNCPMGLLLFERISTNYKQLQTIYHQRKNHKLKEWREFCEWIKNDLPFSHELIIGE